MKYIAHRGRHGKGVKENTKQAIENVFESHVDGVEFDVRLTNDGRCVLLHDSKINGVHVSNNSYEELLERFSELTLLEEALEILQNYGGLINIEIKHLFFEKGYNKGIECVEKVKEILLKYESTQRNIVISSFSFRNIKSVREFIPNVDVAYLIPNPFAFIYWKKQFDQLDANAIHMSAAQAKSPFFKRVLNHAKQNDLSVRCYTVNSLDEALELEKLGVDAVFTDVL